MLQQLRGLTMNPKLQQTVQISQILNQMTKLYKDFGMKMGKSIQKEISRGGEGLLQKRSKGDNTFGSVRPSVRLSLDALLFEHFTLCACCGVVDIWARRAEC